jgi:D-alanyl-lipoteichoic acid acyltransferase DltB (MBOAT superfamily)
MLFGGLWHGASLNFIFWGAAHGVLLMIHRAWTDAGRRMPWPAAWVVTQLCVLFLWVPFRSPTLGTTLTTFESLLGVAGTPEGRAIDVSWFLLAVPLLFDHLLPLMRRKQATRRLPAWAVALLLGALFTLAMPLIRTDVRIFIYFQF